MKSNGTLLKVIIENLKPQLENISDAEAMTKPAPDKWSAKQIIGHLIDSASNNHQRFVRVYFQENLIFNGYKQEDWVAVQDYQNGQWSAIIDLWYTFNLHLAVIVDKIPDVVLYKEHLVHNLDKVAYKVVPKSASTTLDYFIKDYIGHLERIISFKYFQTMNP